MHGPCRQTSLRRKKALTLEWGKQLSGSITLYLCQTVFVRGQPEGVARPG